jgi:hypothetical protein
LHQRIRKAGKTTQVDKHGACLQLALHLPLPVVFLDNVWDKMFQTVFLLICAVKLQRLPVFTGFKCKSMFILIEKSDATVQKKLFFTFFLA